MFIDTHTHLHDPAFTGDKEAALRRAQDSVVSKIIAVGTDAGMSEAAVRFAHTHRGVWASIGLHPHDARNSSDLDRIALLKSDKKVVAIGECGLDYYYLKSPKKAQTQALVRQLELASEVDLPVILHVRGSRDNPADAFDDLWKIWDKQGTGLRGVVHSFSAGVKQMDEALERGLLIALNGIMTFSNDPEHDIICRDVPLEKLVLETDTPFLTPAPFRGKINEPKYVELTAAHLAEVKGVSKQKIAAQTSANAEALFNI